MRKSEKKIICLMWVILALLAVIACFAVYNCFYVDDKTNEIEVEQQCEQDFYPIGSKKNKVLFEVRL